MKWSGRLSHCVIDFNTQDVVCVTASGADFRIEENGTLTKLNYMDLLSEPVIMVRIMAVLQHNDAQIKSYLVHN